MIEQQKCLQYRDDVTALLKTLDLRSGARTLALKTTAFADYRALFGDCLHWRGERIILSIGEFLRQGGSDAWRCEAAALVGYQPPVPVAENHLVECLQHYLPDVDWQHEFVSETRHGHEQMVQEICDGWKAAVFLQTAHQELTLAELGACVFTDSKYLKTHAAVCSWTVRFLRRALMLAPSDYDDKGVLERCGVIGNPTAATVTVFGPFTVTSGGRTLDWVTQLWQLKQSAMLSMDNPVERLSLPQGMPVLTIENETTFNLAKRSLQQFALVYTGGFPGRAVSHFVAAIPSEIPLFHWGDSDPEGYEIAAVLHAIHPLSLYRSDVAALETQLPYMRELNDAKLKRAQRLADTPSFPFKKEILWLLKHRLWLEQERYQES